MNTTTTMPIIAPAALHPEHIIPTPWRDYTPGFHRCKGVKRLGNPGRWEFPEMVQRCTRPVTFNDGLKF